ncbi:MAG: 6-phosphofructokinase [Chloroflexi bacterium]|nr:6-phosphofructokinase [Chloroflexota bacterium]
MSIRIGMLTSGGDCQGLNSAMRGVAKRLYEADPKTEILGFLDGFAGLMKNSYRVMGSKDFSGILTLGGTILGTSRQSFKTMETALYPDQPNSPTKLEAMVKNYHDLDLDALVVLGGNGSHKTANLLYENGLNVVTLPKTIDNDLWGTDITFGFQSAVNIATNVIDGIHSTATSHGRVFIVEVMGHKVGWMTLHAGIAGGADVILIPEIPYDPEVVAKVLLKRDKAGKRFSIIAVAEGARTIQEAKMSKSDYNEMIAESPYISVAYRLASMLNQYTDQEVRVTVPGHFQRGGTPSPYDRVLTTSLGVVAAEKVMRKKFGIMVGMVNNKIVGIPLKEVAGKLKEVPQDHELIHDARGIGIYFGNEQI